MDEKNLQRTNKVDEFITDTSEALKKRLSSLRTQAHIVYGCYVASFIVGITAIIGVVLAYVARNNARELNDKILIDQFTWQIKTFWIGLAFGVLFVISFLTVVLPFIIGAVGLVWFIYRIVKGWSYLSSGKRLYDD